MTDTQASESPAGNSVSVGATRYGWVKGQSGNPSGRPKAFASLIRAKSVEGEKLVSFAFKVLDGEEVNGVKPSIELSFRALEWLADRGWGKAVQNVDVAGQIVHTWDILADLSLEDVKALALAYRALQEQKANAIESESRMLEAGEDVSSN